MTIVPYAKNSLQSVGQLMPAGADVMVPVPALAFCANPVVRVDSCGRKFAVTVLKSFMVSVQVLEPVQPAPLVGEQGNVPSQMGPLQPLKK